MAIPTSGPTASWWKETVVIVAIIGAIGGIIVAIINGLFSSSKSSAQPLPPMVPQITSSSSPASESPSPSTPPSPTASGTSPSDSGSTPAGDSPPTAPSPTKVQLAVLCNASNAHPAICGESAGDPVQVGGVLFSYQGENNAFGEFAPPKWGPILQFSPTTCTSLTIRFASTKATANLQVVQSHSASVTASATGKVGTLTAKLDGGPFTLQANNSNGYQVFVDGYATCNTPSGEISQ